MRPLFGSDTGSVVVAVHDAPSSRGDCWAVAASALKTSQQTGTTILITFVAAFASIGHFPLSLSGALGSGLVQGWNLKKGLHDEDKDIEAVSLYVHFRTSVMLPHSWGALSKKRNRRPTQPCGGGWRVDIAG